MGEPQGVLIIPIGYNPSDEQRAITVDANDYLHTVLATGLTGGGMGEPRGKIAVACGYNPDGKLRTIELDADDNLLITLLGGAANQILSSDGTKFGAATIADVLEAAILTADGDILIRSGGVVQALSKEDDDDVLTLDSGIPAWKVPAAGGELTIIEDVLLASTATSIDFQNIPGTYTHLLIKGVLRTDKVGTLTTGLNIRFNNDSGSNYTTQYLRAYSTTINAAGAGSQTEGDAGVCLGALAPANQASLHDIFIPNYSETTFEKDSIAYSLGVYHANYGQYKFDGTHWHDTSAITRVTIFASASPNFLAGSHLTLYGLN